MSITLRYADCNNVYEHYQADFRCGCDVLVDTSHSTYRESASDACVEVCAELMVD